MKNNMWDNNEDKNWLYFVIWIIIIVWFIMYNDKVDEDNYKKDLSQCILNNPLPKWRDFINNCKDQNHSRSCAMFESSLLSVDLWIAHCIEKNYGSLPIKKCINNLNLYENLVRWLEYDNNYNSIAWSIDDITDDIKNCIYIN